jgi:hypothetical protein
MAGLIMHIINLFIGASITILSLGLFVLSLLSYRKNMNIKMLIVSLVFLFFFIKSMLLSLSLFFNVTIFVDSMYNVWFFDLIVLALLYIASLKR